MKIELDAKDLPGSYHDFLHSVLQAASHNIDWSEVTDDELRELLRVLERVGKRQKRNTKRQARREAKEVSQLAETLAVQEKKRLNRFGKRTNKN